MITLSFVGDLCPINRVEKLFLLKDYHKVYNDFIDKYDDSDYLIANLECPLTKSNTKIQKIGPNLRAHPSVIYGLNFGKINALTLANNHIMDFGFNGLKDTIDICNENKIAVFGAGKNQDDSKKPLVIKKNGIAISILNYCENEFSTAKGDLPGAAPIDLLSNIKDIKSAKIFSDYVVVVVHGGNEYFPYPNPYIYDLFRCYAEMGADVIIGHHPHVVSGYEKYNNSLLFYSLGNFLFDNNSKVNTLWNLGAMLKLRFSNEIKFEYIPLFQNDIKAGVRSLTNHETNEFNFNIDRINKILNQPHLLNEQWVTFAKEREPDYFSRLIAYNDVTKKIFKQLKMYRWLTSKQHLFLKNYFCCQSHNELLKEIMKKKDL